MDVKRPMDDFVTDRPITDSSITFIPDASLSSDSGIHAYHGLECDLRRDLMTHPDLNFAELILHRIEDGICLEGTLVIDRDCPDVCSIVRDLAEVSIVMNRLKIVRNHGVPPKG